ncbi:MAG: UDP-glucose/GDP-mannose dehydrogenase family protein [Gammaproteobacteria bacterium]|nr:UDP-glucose/GDP-mannose dehydrogenase family protein [Gammaproteobacteria bacterium]
MNITIIGTGYVGLVTGACFAEVGNHVVCVDNDSAKIDCLLAGEIPIYEPGLDALVAENVSAGRLSFTTDIKQGVDHAEVLMLAVGTPPDEDGSADLKHILSVAESIGDALTDYRVVVTKSTVPVGTAGKVRERIENRLKARNVGIEFSVVSNPEFLKEGAAIEDFLKPDRVVIGADDERGAEIMRSLYAPFNRNHDRVIMMDIRSAELTKYAANAMLATKISFINEIANLSEKLGADIESVRRGIGSDPRIGYHFIYPGCGYGGSCFPKDVQALYRTAQSHDFDSRVLAAVEAVNNDQKTVLLNKALEHFAGNLSGRRFALWGLAFKPDTDDVREAPSRTIMEGLWSHGASVAAYDPVATTEIQRVYGERDDLSLNKDDPYAVLDQADGLMVVTEWKMFRSPNLDKIKRRLQGDVIFDGRNIFDPVMVKRTGLVYYGIGRGHV